MSDPLFQEAYARARRHFSDSGWIALNPREITEAIYEEIRRIDAERAAAQAPIDAGERKGLADKPAAKHAPRTGSTASPTVNGPGGKSRARVAVSRTRPNPQMG